MTFLHEDAAILAAAFSRVEHGLPLAYAYLSVYLVKVLVLCRITPGLLFPTFVACGWFRIPFSRFALVSIVSGAVYSSIVLTMIILFWGSCIETF